MEKRLFLAVALSLGVLFVFQAFFAPKNTHSNKLQTVVINSVIENTATSAGLKSVVTEVGSVQVAKFKEETMEVKAGKFDFLILNNGGSISGVYLNDYQYEFPVKAIADVQAFDGKPFSYSKQGDNSFILSLKDPEWNVEKKITVNDYKINVVYNIKNVTQTTKTLDLSIKPFNIDLSSLDKPAFKKQVNKSNSAEWTLFEYALNKNNKIERKEQVHNFNDKWNKEETVDFKWIAFRDHYFVTIVEPKKGFKGYSTKMVNDKRLDFTAVAPAVIVEPGNTVQYELTVFCGPQRLDVLKNAENGFEKVLVFSSWGWLDAIAKLIYWVLGAVHKILPIWGLCIIAVSFLVYAAMYPLTLKSMISMKKMQALQPKMAKLKEKYKDNPEKLNKETIELYRVNNVNPVSGCLPMLLQMPIFVGLYQVLWRSIYFRGESFLWIKDLSMPDRLFKLPVSIIFIGEYFNILPLLMTGIMFVQQKITMKSMAGGDPEQMQQQKMMAIMMPVMLGVMFYNFASGLNLYFVVFYSLSALSQWHISKNTPTAP